MKIGIDGRLWNETGVGRYIRNLVWELGKIDKKNDYVLFVKKGFKIEDLPAGKAGLGFKNDRWKVVETNIHWHSLQEQLRFPKILSKENLDLMHFTYYSLPIFYNKPFVVTIHDLILTHFPTGKASTLPYPLYRMKRFGYDFVMNHSIQNSKKIIVPLNTVKEDVVQTFGVSEEKVVVTYEGVEQVVKSKWQMENSLGKYFLYVGNAYPHKNVEFLIQAFLAYKKEVRGDTKLVLVGKDDFFYQRIHARMAENKDIVFKHAVSDEALASLYAHAAGFVSASHMEGFGLPPLEALSFGCPVILSDIPSFREVCEDLGFYFDPTDISSLTRQFMYVSDLHGTKQEERRKKGHERVKQFSWEKMAKETLAVYQQ